MPNQEPASAWIFGNGTVRVGTQGQSVGSGEKAGRKFSSTGERAPGYRLSPNYFQKFKQMPAPDWAQQMLCIIVLNRRTVFPEFFSWVRTRQLLTRSRLVLLMHALKKWTQSGNFQFDINSPFRNTVFPKTKGAFPKRQVWAYNRYSRFHRSRLRKDKGAKKAGNFIYPMMHRFILYYQASARTWSDQFNRDAIVEQRWKATCFARKPSVPLLCRSIYDFRSTIPNVNVLSQRECFGRRLLVN